MTRISQELKQRSRKLRRNQTDAERILWYHLRKREVNNCKFRRQHPLGPLDFICLESKLIIEVDGGQHTKIEVYDEKRTHHLKQAAFRILRFWNNEIMNDLDAVLDDIYRALQFGN